MIVQGGATDVTTYFALRSTTTGDGATGLTITNIDLQYVRSGAVPAAKVDAAALAATDTAHTDNRAIEIDATDQPGLYRVDWPDAAFAAGVREVILTVKCTGVFTEHLRVEIDPLGAIADASDIADAVWDEAQAGHVASGSFGEVATEVAAILVDTAEIGAAGAGLTAVPWNASWDAEVQSEVTDALNVYDPPTKAELDAAVAPLATAANLATVAGYLDTEIAAILADTSELQTDWANGGRLDLILDARASQTSVDDLPTSAELATALAGADDAVLAQIALVKAKTDGLTFTVAGVLDANIQYVNDVQVTGAGTTVSPWYS